MPSFTSTHTPYDYKLMGLSHCPTHFFTLTSSYLSIGLVNSPMHLTDMLTVSGHLRVHFSSEICLHVVVPGGLYIPEILCNVLLLSFVTLPSLIRE